MLLELTCFKLAVAFIGQIRMGIFKVLKSDFLLVPFDMIMKGTYICLWKGRSLIDFYLFLVCVTLLIRSQTSY